MVGPVDPHTDTCQELALREGPVLGVRLVAAIALFGRRAVRQPYLK
jgi:hypothetical protein